MRCSKNAAIEQKEINVTKVRVFISEINQYVVMFDIVRACDAREPISKTVKKKGRDAFKQGARPDYSIRSFNHLLTFLDNQLSSNGVLALLAITPQIQVTIVKMHIAGYKPASPDSNAQPVQNPHINHIKTAPLKSDKHPDENQKHDFHRGTEPNI